MNLAIVLVRPSRAANVGAAARALKNFGWRDLRVVGASSALPGGSEHSEARALAWNAADVLESARAFDDLRSAVADLHFTAAATARAQPGEELSPEGFAREAADLPEELAAGCVFGPETHGLSNVELDCCRARVRIPTDPEQPSLNLAQAVVVTAYEAAKARRGHSTGVGGRGAAGLAARPLAPGELPASEAELQRFHEAARKLALRAGYLNPQAPEHVAGELRRMLQRARPTRREVTLLLGLVAQLDWAHRKAP